LDTVEIGIGAPGYQASDLHFVYGVEGEFQEGLEVGGQNAVDEWTICVSRLFSIPLSTQHSCAVDEYRPR
jgi:hypothetical protein